MNILRWLFAAIDNFGDIAQEDRPLVRHTHNHIPDVFGGLKKFAGFEQQFTVSRGVTPGFDTAIGSSQRHHNLNRSHRIGG